MNMPRDLLRPATGERGMALISALLLLLVISLLAVGLSMDSSMDIRFAAYQKFRARSFGFAESGLMAAGDILESNIDDAGWTPTVPFSFPHLSPEYDDIITGGDIRINGAGSFYMEENTGMATVMTMTGEIPAEVIVQRIDAILAEGGAMQVAAGYAGMGKGIGGGGAHIIYNIEATGTDADNVRTNMAMHYRVVTK